MGRHSRLGGKTKNAALKVYGQVGVQLLLHRHRLDDAGKRTACRARAGGARVIILKQVVVLAVVLLGGG